MKLFQCAVVSAIACCATPTTAHAINKIDLALKKQIENYFIGSIEGRDTLPFEKSRSLNTRDITQTREAVWHIWQKANEAANEEKLPELKPLSMDVRYSWSIPETLEPDAEMAFYYGYKGDSIPANGYPLYIYLHGSGPRDAEWKTGIALAETFDDAPLAYFVPRIPNEGQYYRWWQRGKQYIWDKLFRQSIASGKIDPNRIYLVGISEGGYGSQRLASFYADYLAGAGPMAGGEPLKNAPVENCRNIAFSLRTGADDDGFYRNLLTRYTKETFDSMTVSHPGYYKHEVELIPGRGHSIDYSVTTPWLKTNVRDPHVTRVTWEDFEMDGSYRNGFANFYVAERSNPNDSTRTVYDLTIEDNTIYLNAQLVSYTTVEKDSIWGIPLKFQKHYQRATEGRVKLYLDERMVDLKKPVTLIINGHEQFTGKLKLNVRNMVNSCSEFCDPERIYPAMLDIYL